MIRLLATSLLLASAAFAQETPPPAAPPPAPAEAPKPRTTDIILKTPLGAITIALEVERAPISSNYILKYVDGGRLDGSSFYRAYKITADGSLGLIQGGVMTTAKLLPPVAHEPTSKTGLSHTEGWVSLARGAPGTATANFFIILGDLHQLDAQPPGQGDPDGYAVFGRVVAGMDVVRAILNAPISATKGEGVMRGQMIEAPVPIITARRAIPLPKPAVVAKPGVKKKR
jgi:peptidyl-prolyl cis-trans isomerase A (cyclophilin A)